MSHKMTGQCKPSEGPECRKAFENWVPNVNQAPVIWIGHSYANAYMAAQWEGFKASWDHNAQLLAQRDELLAALKEMVSIVKIHSEAIGNDFAWAEMYDAETAIANAEKE